MSDPLTQYIRSDQSLREKNTNGTMSFESSLNIMEEIRLRRRRGRVYEVDNSQFRYSGENTEEHLGCGGGSANLQSI